jgi:hypothetical protein
LWNAKRRVKTCIGLSREDYRLCRIEPTSYFENALKQQKKFVQRKHGLLIRYNKLFSWRTPESNEVSTEQAQYLERLPLKQRILLERSPGQFQKLLLEEWHNAQEEHRKLVEKFNNFQLLHGKVGWRTDVDATEEETGEKTDMAAPTRYLSTDWLKLNKEEVRQYLELHPILSKTSKDVRDFIVNNRHLEPAELKQLLCSPVRYFAAPHRVPYEDRQQIFLYDSPLLFSIIYPLTLRIAAPTSTTASPSSAHPISGPATPPSTSPSTTTNST